MRLHCYVLATRSKILAFPVPSSPKVRAVRVRQEEPQPGQRRCASPNQVCEVCQTWHLPRRSTLVYIDIFICRFGFILIIIYIFLQMSL